MEVVLKRFCSALFVKSHFYKLLFIFFDIASLSPTRTKKYFHDNCKGPIKVTKTNVYGRTPLKQNM